jgi:cysteinyl-tRNA synthetase
MQLSLTNTLTRRKEIFSPLNSEQVTMYVCGPTVYARPHIGNARSVVVYDVLFRLLQRLYPRVTYARNITDVDDKINAAAIARVITIQALTEEVTQQFHADMDALCVLRPTIEPRATTHIPQMIAMIEALIAHGHAYVAQGHVLYDVTSNPQYGKLSGRSRDDMIAGARVEIAPYKKDPADFVLWKPAHESDDASSRFASPWGEGRPGWHIECSAMSTTHLGQSFDIHGGGADLMFPHHENEIAQACCAAPNVGYARFWVHNGFLSVNGEKMSKSLGNFITVHDLLSRGVKGEVIRFALMSTRYNEPLDWTDKLLTDSEKVLDRLYRRLGDAPITTDATKADAGVLQALCDDLNTPKALALLQMLEGASLVASAQFLGLLMHSPAEWFQGASEEDTAWIEEEIAKRKAAKAARDFVSSDAIRDDLKARGIILEDKPDGSVIWRRG